MVQSQPPVAELFFHRPCFLLMNERVYNLQQIVLFSYAGADPKLISESQPKKV